MRYTVQTNCLYPEFCKRKNGEEEIIYDLEACEELLKDTYGLPFITGDAFIPKLADFSKVMPMFYVKRWGRSKRCP
jgi:DNA polymerase-3 subunit alpha